MISRSSSSRKVHKRYVRSNVNGYTYVYAVEITGELRPSRSSFYDVR